MDSLATSWWIDARCLGHFVGVIGTFVYRYDYLDRAGALANKERGGSPRQQKRMRFIILVRTQTIPVRVGDDIHYCHHCQQQP